MRQNIFSKIVLIAGVAIFASVFLFARAVISISFILIIILFLVNRDFSLERSKLKHYTPLLFLLLSGIVITASYFYAFLIGDQSISINDFISYSNPIIIVLYTCSLSYFLSKNKNFSNYLIWAYLVISVVFSLFCLIKFLCYPNIDLVGVYGSFGRGGDVQGVIGFTFPFVSVCLINLAIQSKKIISKVIFACSALLVIFVDLSINTSKIGYIVETFVFFYYAFIFTKTYSIKNNKISIRKILINVLLAFTIAIAMLGGFLKESTIFHTKVEDVMVSLEEVFGSAKLINKTTDVLETKSTGLRMIYYTSSVKIFEEYPSVFLLGCSLSGNTASLDYCTESLIKNSQKLQNDAMVIKNAPIEPHNVFLTYTFKGGVFAGLCVLIFFLTMIYNTKYFMFGDRFSLSVLVLAYFIASCTGYYMSTQYEVITFFTLFGAFLSRADMKKKDE